MKNITISPSKSIYYLIFILFPALAYSQTSFEPYKVYPTGSWPEVVCIGDVNNDGLNDVVMGTSFYFDPVNDFKIFVYLQNEDGDLVQQGIYAYPQGGWGIGSIDIADVNNDQLNDVVIAHDYSIGIFYQNSSGTLNSVVSTNSQHFIGSLKTGDLNHDGRTDIAFYNDEIEGMHVMCQTDSGFTVSSYPKPYGNYDEIEVGDLNNDGLDDIAYGIQAGSIGGLHIYTQAPNGIINPFTSYYPGTYYVHLAGIAIGDLNQDGLKDIAASSYADYCVFLWMQNPITALLDTPAVKIPLSKMPESIEIEDMNCNGKNDILILNSSYSMSCLEQNNSGQYIAVSFPIPYATHYNQQGISIGDINHDGLKDVAIASYNDGLVILINNSLPVTYSYSDTVVAQDTTTSSNITALNYSTQSTTDTLSHFVITTTDSLKISCIYQVDSIRMDSLIVYHIISCSTITDTLIISDYKVETSLLGCDTIIYNTTIDSVNILNDVIIYPNPTYGIVMAELPPPFDSHGTKFQIFNYLGESIYQEEKKENENIMKINLSGLVAGIYLFSFRNQSATATKKVILQK